MEDGITTRLNGSEPLPGDQELALRNRQEAQTCFSTERGPGYKLTYVQ